jgi:hypothetical protein
MKIFFVPEFNPKEFGVLDELGAFPNIGSSVTGPSLGAGGENCF